MSINNEKLEEMMKANKADDSILRTINDNQDEYVRVKKNIELIGKKIEEIQKDLDAKMIIKSNIPVYKVKDFAMILKEIINTKRLLKAKIDEKEYMEQYCQDKLNESSAIEREIDEQYKFFQENETYKMAVEKVNNNSIELAPNLYSTFIENINNYMNAVYSISENTRLTEPNVSDLVMLLEIISKFESEKKDTAVKKTTRKRATRKTTTKKKAEGEEIDKSVTDASKDSKSIDSLDDDKAEAKPKKRATRKTTTKKNVANNEVEEADENKKDVESEKNTEPTEQPNDNNAEEAKPKKRATRKTTTKKTTKVATEDISKEIENEKKSENE